MGWTSEEAVVVCFRAAYYLGFLGVRKTSARGAGKLV
jgi:hypothetical protein